MSRKAYTEAERVQIRERLVSTGLELYARQGIQHTTLAQIYETVGISRTFFYSFFPTKEEFVLQVLYHQQPLLLQHVQNIMDRADLCWRDKVRQFLLDCCYSSQNGIVIMSIEEEQAVRRNLTQEGFQAFQREQYLFFSELLTVFGVPSNAVNLGLFGNLVLAMVLCHRAIPDAMPFLFPEMADAMVQFQVNAIVNYMEECRNAAKE